MAKNRSIGRIIMHNLEQAHREGRGRSKRIDRAKGRAAGRIYSDVTEQNYVKCCRRFIGWVRLEHPESWKNLDAAAALVPGYLEAIPNPGTRATVANALAKGFGIGTGREWGVEYGHRRLAQIWRGRQLSARAAAWRRNHPVEAEACRCLGPRCEKEAMAIQGRDVHQHPDGSVTVHIIGKGKLEREATVWSAPDNTVGRDWILRRAHEVGPGGWIFHGVPDLPNANLHALRAEYAARMYRHYLHDGHTPTGKLYRPRDGSEVVLDRGVLAAVNRDIGHGDNRPATDWYNYLSYGGLD
jgi:hypothetical protein